MLTQYSLQSETSCGTRHGEAAKSRHQDDQEETCKEIKPAWSPLNTGNILNKKTELKPTEVFLEDKDKNKKNQRENVFCSFSFCLDHIFYILTHERLQES